MKNRENLKDYKRYALSTLLGDMLQPTDTIRGSSVLPSLIKSLPYRILCILSASIIHHTIVPTWLYTVQHLIPRTMILLVKDSCQRVKLNVTAWPLPIKEVNFNNAIWLFPRLNTVQKMTRIWLQLSRPEYNDSQLSLKALNSRFLDHDQPCTLTK